MHHAVVFATASAAPPASEYRAIDQFLGEIGIRASDDARVGVADDGTGPGLAERRASSLIAYLKTRGLDAVRGDAQGGATITVTRYVVTTPDCPDFSKASVTDFTNLPSSNFGCATAVNLSLMVADPADLHHGRDLGGADGVRMAAAVYGYRTGALPPLTSEDDTGTLAPLLSSP